MLKDFNHVNAKTVDEAISLLKSCNGEANLIAGGTDLLGILKDRILPHYPDTIINIKTIKNMDYIKEDGDCLRIGALVKLEEIAQSPVIRERYGILADASKAVATPQIRNLGTMGGNLCQDVRCLYYRYPHQMGGRILCKRKGSGPCFAVTGDNRYNAIMGGEGCFAVCPSDLAVAPIHVRVSEAEEFLKGKLITERVAEQAAEIALEKAKPLSMNAYKIPIAKNLVKQSILVVGSNP